VTQKRVLILEEDALVMVVNKDVTSQVDERRGELTRTEFINLLIHQQLKEETRPRHYVEKEEFYHFVQDIKALMRDFLDFTLNYGLSMGKEEQEAGFADWCQKIDSLDSPDNASDNASDNA